EPVACMASMIARVPVEATPASALPLGPRAESTASVPSTAVFNATGSGSVRSTRKVGTSSARRSGLRTTTSTSWPAATAWDSRCWPVPPVAATVGSFIGLGSSFFVGAGRYLVKEVDPVVVHPRRPNREGVCDTSPVADLLEVRGWRRGLAQLRCALQHRLRRPGHFHG